MRRPAALILGRRTMLRRAIALACAERGIDIIVAGFGPADPPDADRETARRYGVRVSRMTIPTGATAVRARDFDAASRRHRGVDIVIALDPMTGGAADLQSGRSWLGHAADRTGTSLLAMALPHMVWSRWGRVIRVVGSPDVLRWPGVQHEDGAAASAGCGVTFITIVAPQAVRCSPAGRSQTSHEQSSAALPTVDRGGPGASCEPVAGLVIRLCSEVAGAVSHVTLRL